MKVRTLFLALLLALPLGAAAQKSVLRERTAVSVATMMGWRDTTTGIWENAGWWNSANVLAALLRYGAATGDAAIPALANRVYEQTKVYRWVGEDGEKHVCTHYNNDFYDDQGWWALAWIEAYELTGRSEYLEMAETIYVNMSTGWTDELGGGIYWKKNPLQYKNAIANNLYSLLAARLFRHTQKAEYRKRFLEASDWMLQSGMLNCENWQVEDGLEESGTPNCGHYYTYNQGVCMASRADRRDAVSGFGGARCRRHPAPYDERRRHPPRAPSRNGVERRRRAVQGHFMRHLAHLYRLDKRADYRDFILRNARSIVERDYDAASRSFGCFWGGPFREVQPAANGCALDCLAEALALE